MRSRGAAAAGVALVALAMVAASCSRAAPTSFADGHVRAQAIVLHDPPGAVQAVVTSHGAIVMLASSNAAQLPGQPNDDGDLLLRSTDDGVTWTRSPSPLGTAGPPGAVEDFGTYVAKRGLQTAGGWLVATRTIGATPVPTQLVALSQDAGLTWRRVTLPTPPGTASTVTSVAEVDGHLVLGGGLRTTTPGPAKPTPADGRPSSMDAAVWRGNADGTAFERSGSTSFDGLPKAQLVAGLVAQGHRTVAVVAESAFITGGICCGYSSQARAWASDDGTTWTELSGFPAPEDNPVGFPVVVPTPDTLAVAYGSYRYLLAPGSSTWRQMTPIPDWDASAPGVSGRQGGLATTWNEDSACDCSVAFGGRLEGDRLADRRRLTFHSCTDTTVRGSTEVGRSALVGSTVVAVAACSDKNAIPASLAWSRDGGSHWQTTRLTRLAGTIHADEIEVFGAPGPQVVAPDGSLVAFATSRTNALLVLRFSPTD